MVRVGKVAIGNMLTTKNDAIIKLLVERDGIEVMRGQVTCNRYKAIVKREGV